MTAPDPSPRNRLAAQLLEGLRTHQRFAPETALTPPDRDAAYRIQQDLIVHLGSPVAAWKVGTAPTAGEVLGSPIPACCVQQSPARVALAAHDICGVELEVAFRFKQGFPLREAPYTDAEVFDALALMAPAIEIVSSRYQGWPDLPDFLKLADLQNHGALILGPALPYAADFPFLDPRVHLTVGGTDRAKSPAGNPAGDPRWLLPPFVRQCSARGLPIEAHHWVTTGSYSGIYFVASPGAVIGHLADLPEVRLDLT